MGLPCQIRPPRARRGPASAHSRTSPDFSATTPAHAPNSLLRASPVPRACPPPHFAQHCPLSRSALAARRRRRSAPAFPTIQLAGDRAKPPRSPPRGETHLIVPNFPYCALCLANFGTAGARPRRSAVLVRWLANLPRSSSPALVPKVPLPLLKLAQALARLKPLPVVGMPRRSSSGPPETLSSPFSPLCMWIHGLFPAIEFVVAFSPSLLNSGDLRATLARVCLNSSDLTAAERATPPAAVHPSPV
jgi:hypothetical protein